MNHQSLSDKETSLRWAEFFAGGGMARAGLGSKWQCVFANDFDQTKVSCYRENWTSDHLIHGDIRFVSPESIPDNLELAWASTPCQNFSSAGIGDGLLGNYSSIFLAWWELIRQKISAGSPPKIIVLENVRGLLRSRKGQDFHTLAESFTSAGYKFGVVLVDTIHFLPQSRPRIFLIAVRGDQNIPRSLFTELPITTWHPSDLINAVENLPANIRERYIWWHLPKPPALELTISDILDHEGLAWHSPAQTQKLLDTMSHIHREKIRIAANSTSRIIGTLFRRMRPHEGKSRSFTEVRFDGIAGCLRASDGGSSRQMLIVIDGESVKTRHMTSRESARLMGLPENYSLPTVKTHAAKLIGDGVAVPVVRFLSDSLLLPLALACGKSVQETLATDITSTQLEAV